MFHSLRLSRPAAALLVAYVALFSANSIHSFVVPVPQHTASSTTTSHTRVSFSGFITNKRGDKPSTGGVSNYCRNPRYRRNRQQQLSLEAVPPSVWWVLSHTTLPFSGIPFVINGTREGGWYRKIDLPPWTPPDRLFGPVWTFLYTCMGLAASRISRLSPKPAFKNPLIILWLAHFCLNISWAPIFFGLQRFRLGLVISYGLIGSLAAILPLFYSVDPTSAFLLIPYFLWLSFATFGLNVSICKRNPTKNGYNDGMFQAQLIKLQENAASLVGLI